MRFLSSVYSNFQDHPHPPEIPVKHQLATIDTSTGKHTFLGPPTPGGAIGQQTGAIGKDGALYTLNNFYNGTDIQVRIEKHSLSDGGFLGHFPIAGVPFIEWCAPLLMRR